MAATNMRLKPRSKTTKRERQMYRKTAGAPPTKLLKHEHLILERMWLGKKRRLRGKGPGIGVFKSHTHRVVATVL